jgi:hypothetical protein
MIPASDLKKDREDVQGKKMEDPSKEKNGAEFKSFARIRILLAVVLVGAAVWALIYGLGYLDKFLLHLEDGTPKLPPVLETTGPDQPQTGPLTIPMESKAETTGESAIHQAHPSAEEVPHDATQMPAVAGENKAQVPPTQVAMAPSGQPSETAQQHPPTKVIEKSAVPAPKENQAQPAPPAKIEVPAKPPAAAEHIQPAPAPAQTSAAETSVRTPLPPGIAFVQATIEPLNNELHHRWWGWRPNDILNLTDNVNNFQLGVLEVTRRTVVQLAERISRTGSTDAFNPHLENAMNWIMVSPDRYWFPSPESKYKDSLAELEIYKNQILAKKASFYTRSDNIIPLLAAFEDLLGSCDENLVKTEEKDGSKVSYFSTDDYFYYAKGIASAMVTILEAAQRDFTDVLEKRNGAELLHHAIESCRRASELSPLIITNADLDGILANHRANMAAPISHAKFFLGQLIKTLST